jgi:Xaa-Pro aminopeptidase/Xaa-Pro dipeptidase
LTLVDGADVIATKPQNIFYLTGFWGGAVAIVTTDKTILICSKMEVPRATKQSRETEVYEARRPGSLLAEAKKHLNSKKHIADRVEQDVQGKLYVEDEKPFLKARSIKDTEEIDNVRKASGILDRSFSRL